MRFRLPLTVVVAALSAASACKKSEPRSQPSGTAPARDATAGTAGQAVEAGLDTSTPTPATGPLAQPFFWEISKGGKRTYLLGTIHLGVTSERLPASVQSRFDSAKSFAMETDISDPSLLSAVMRDDGTTLDQELGADYWKKLEQVLGEALAGGVKGLKASAVATLVAIQGLPMTDPMDMALMRKAKAANKKVVYLEKATDQQALLDKWMDVRALKAMLDDIENTRTRNRQLLAVYEAGDEQRLVALGEDKASWQAMGRSEQELAQAMEELLFARNRAWVPAIEALHGKDAFIAVGAMHLVGSKSVIELLRARGFEVNRVTGP